MADHWIFDKATNINGSAVSGLTLNNAGFDELYYDGTHIAHFAKDVSVSINRGCFKYIDRYSKTFKNYDSCGTFESYGRSYYVKVQAYTRIYVDQNSASPGRRIKKLSWGKWYSDSEGFARFFSGDIENPQGQYLIPNLVLDILIDDETDSNGFPPENWDNKPSSITIHNKSKAEGTVYFTDGTSISGSNGHHTKWTNHKIFSLDGILWVGENAWTASATK
mgnify:CR=1 FL=1